MTIDLLTSTSLEIVVKRCSLSDARLAQLPFLRIMVLGAAKLCASGKRLQLT